MQNVERRVHIVFADNVTPELDANNLRNNDLIDSYVLDVDAFIEDFEDEFKVLIDFDQFNTFKTIGDIVLWTESKNEIA
mgnify:CR=1 FL=1